MLGSPKGGALESEAEVVEQHHADAHNNKDSKTELDECSFLISPIEPTTGIKTNEIQIEEMQEAVQKARARSAPGCSGRSYKVYKKCPKLLKRLWKLVNAVWKKEIIPECWQREEGCFVRKEKNLTFIKQFLTIPKWLMQGILLGSIKKTNYNLANRYLYTSVQKGGAPEVS